MSVWLPAKSVSGTDNSLNLSGISFRVSSFTFDKCNTLLFSDAFSEWAVIPICSPLSEYAMTLIASCPADALIGLIAKSILEATILSKSIKIAFWVLSSTVSTILLFSLSILSSKHLSRVFKIHLSFISH